MVVGCYYLCLVFGFGIGWLTDLGDFVCIVLVGLKLVGVGLFVYVSYSLLLGF